MVRAHQLTRFPLTGSHLAVDCTACHQPTGKGGGTIKPLDGAAVVLDADKTKQVHVVLNGQNAMPAWNHSPSTRGASESFT